MLLSALPYLEFIAGFYATIFIGFGILWFIDPSRALSFFDLAYPQVQPQQIKRSSSNEKDDTKDGKNSNTTPTERIEFDAKKTLDVVAVIYGIRNISMGFAIYASALFGTRLTLGWIVIAAGCVAAVDGAACKFLVGTGEMNHWSYAPVLVVLGGVLVGGFDWVPL